MAVAPLHVLPMQDQVLVWFFICLWMCWASYRECVRIVAVIGDDRGRGAASSRTVRWLGVIALLTATLPTLNCLQRGQVTVVIVYFLLLGVRLTLTGRSRLAQLLGGIILAVPVVIKIVPILPVGFLLFLQFAGFVQSWWRREESAPRRSGQFAATSLGVALGLVLVFLLVPAMLVGWKANLRHLDTWSELVLANAEDSTATPGFEKDTHSVRNQCLGNALYRLGNFGAYMCANGPEDPLVDGPDPPPRLMDSPSVDPCLLVVRAAMMLTLLLVGLRLAGHRDAGLGQAAGFGLACTALLVVSPVAQITTSCCWPPACCSCPCGWPRTAAAVRQ